MSTATILAPARISAPITANIAATHVTGVKARMPLARLSLQQRRRRLAPTPLALPAIALPSLPCWVKRLALRGLLLPHSGLFVWSAFWDTMAIHDAPADLRPVLRRRAARERAATLRTFHQIQRKTQRVYGRACDSAALWDIQVAMLLDTQLAARGERLIIAVDRYGALGYHLTPISAAIEASEAENERNPTC